MGGYPTACVKDDPTGCPAQTPTSDKFTCTNAPSEQVGFLLDGMRGGVEINDERKVITASAAKAIWNVGHMTSSSQGDEMLSFSRGRAPDRHSAPWTTGNDNFSRPMTNTVRVPITVWIVTAPGTFAAQSVQAFSTVIQAGALFEQERVGIDFDAIEVRDATNDADQPTFTNTTGTALLQTQIGRIANRFNVYWVPAVNGGTGNGVGEVVHGDAVAVGMNAAPGLLAHELGHNLALDHIDGDPRFDGTNVMQSAGGTRLFFTEGQAYRAHIRTISAIRSTNVYSLRPTMPIIDTCNISSTTRNCPMPDKRIWSDGATWPAN